MYNKKIYLYVFYAHLEPKGWYHTFSVARSASLNISILGYEVSKIKVTEVHKKTEVEVYIDAYDIFLLIFQIRFVHFACAARDNTLFFFVR